MPLVTTPTSTVIAEVRSPSFVANTRIDGVACETQIAGVVAVLRSGRLSDFESVAPCAKNDSLPETILAPASVHAVPDCSKLPPVTRV
jgi:hypothetical protein